MSEVWSQDVLANGQCQHTLIASQTLDGGSSLSDATKAAMVLCADKAFSMFDETVLDSSMFCLFEWKADEGSLTIVVTDETKLSEGKHKVSVILPELKNEDSDDFIEDTKAFIRDYLTTCLPFLQYSLIAGFVLGNRNQISML